mmetsp:Transcript_31674/g.48214  ORF Transcript_31674/g.48214 Transcript_31674/m.48214 type:complete len:84 (+) Transcript_31674:418-669(+)
MRLKYARYEIISDVLPRNNASLPIDQVCLESPYSKNRLLGVTKSFGFRNKRSPFTHPPHDQSILPVIAAFRMVLSGCISMINM